MHSLIHQLQADALDPNVKVSDLLRKALLAARKLKLDDAQRILRREVEGYQGEEDVPPARQLVGQVKFFNPYKGWCPIVFDDGKTEQLFTQRPCFQPIAEIEHLLESDSKEFHIPFPGAIQAHFRETIGADMQTALWVQSSSLAFILEHARNTVLEWAASLEENGITGEGLSFNQQEVERANDAKEPMTLNFYGSVSASNIQQGVTSSHQTLHSEGLSLDAVFKALPGLASFASELSEAEAQDAQAEIATMEAQSKSSKPNKAIVRASLESLHRIFEKVTASGAVEVIKTLLD